MASRDDREAKATDRVRGPETGGRRVLVVDDDADLLRTLAAGLRRAGHAVGTAADGFEAVSAAVRAQWDLILLDLRVPYRNGVEVLRLLRTRSDTGAIPVCALTTAGDEAFAERALREGASGALDKSEMDPASLVRRVDEILRALPTAAERVPDGQADESAEPATEGMGGARGGRPAHVLGNPGAAAMETARAGVPATALRTSRTVSRIGSLADGAAASAGAAGPASPTVPPAHEVPLQRGPASAAARMRAAELPRARTQPVRVPTTGMHTAALRKGGRSTARGSVVDGDATREVPVIPSAVEEIARRLKGRKSETGDPADGPPTAAIETSAGAAAAHAPTPPAPPKPARPTPPPPVRPTARPRPAGRNLSMGILEAAVMAAHATAPTSAEPPTAPLGFPHGTGTDRGAKTEGAPRVGTGAQRPARPVTPPVAGHSSEPGAGAGVGVGAAPGTDVAAPGPVVTPPLRPDVVHLRLSSDLAPLARAVGLRAEADCPLCGARFALHLEPDTRVERGVRGRFACPDCPPDRV